MKISLFCEHILPRPWSEESEYNRLQQSIAQFELADKAGFHCAWMTEHHFLEEYCHASAPEVFLAGLSQRTKRIRLGHGIVQMIPGINHPARVAERIATLDLLSGGRVEFGTGEGSSETELGGFHIDPAHKREMWRESLDVAVRCMSDTPFSGIDGAYVTMPARNVVPKPRQKPHPPIWLACTREETITLAAENGIGALSFSFAGPERFRSRVERYYSTLATRCVPVGRVVNANILASAGQLLCGPTDEVAKDRIGVYGGFFGFGINHYYLQGDHQPGVTNVWDKYIDSVRNDPGGIDTARLGGVGSPETLRAYLRTFEDIGVDQVMFLIPPVRHELILESLDRMGREVLPEFIDRDNAASEAKARRMEPIIEAAMMRIRRAPPVDPDYRIGSIPIAWDGVTRSTEIVEVQAQIAAELEQYRKEQEAAQRGRSVG